MQDRYSSTKNKVTDFLVGFFLIPLALTLFSLIYSRILMVFSQYLNNFGTDLLNIVSVTLNFILVIGLLYWLFKSGRKFVAIGMLCTLLVPLLLFGSCLAFFATAGGL